MDLEQCTRQTQRMEATPAVAEHKNWFVNILNSFRPRDSESEQKENSSPLHRALKSRHLQFIAIGGSIGAGLFIGCGKALAIGGPASLLIAFSVVSIMLFCVMHALGELAAVYPISGNSIKTVLTGRILLRFLIEIHR
jgi:amino acid permease